MGEELTNNAGLIRKLLSDDQDQQRWNMGHNNMLSPLIHLRFNEKWVNDDIAHRYFEIIANEARKKGVLVYNAIYLPQEFGISDKADPRPSLRICVTTKHTKQQLTKAADIIKSLLIQALEKKQDFIESHMNQYDEEEMTNID